MFKDVFKLKKKSWYMWLMKYIWGLDYYDFSHVCPVFWITIINIVIFPFTAVVKLVCKLFNYLSAIHIRKSNEKSELKYKFREELIDKIKRDPIILKDYITKIVQREEGDIKKLPKVYRGLYNEIYYYSNDDFRTKFVQLRREIEAKREEILEEKRQQLRKKAAADYQSMLKRKQMIAKLVKYTKPLGQGILIILSLLLVYLIGLGIYHLFKSVGNISHKNLIIALQAMVIILVGGILTFSLYKIIEIIIDYICTKTRNTRIDSVSSKPRVNYLIFIVKPFIWFGKGIASIVGIGIQIAKNNCPGIEWE